MKSWLLDENAHKYLGFFRPKFPPDFLFSLASLDSFPPGEAIGCCRTRGFIDSLTPPVFKKQGAYHQQIHGKSP